MRFPVYGPVCLRGACKERHSGCGRQGCSPGPRKELPKDGCQEVRPAGRQPVNSGSQVKQREERDPGKSGRSHHRWPGTPSTSAFSSLFSRFAQAPVLSFAQSVNNRQLNPGRNSTLSASSTDCCRKNDTTPSSGQTCKLLQISPSLLHSHS